MSGCRDTVGFAYEKITVSSTAIGGTSATYAPVVDGGAPRAKAALITVETNPIRIKYSGGAATATDGHLLAAGDSIRIEGAASVAQISMIRTGSDATVHVTYER